MSISFIDSLNKILTWKMTDRLNGQEFSKIDEAQSGFRRGYSTVEKYLACLSKQGGRLYCLFVDVSKAFDSISFEKLIKSFRQRGVGGFF